MMMIMMMIVMVVAAVVVASTTIMMTTVMMIMIVMLMVKICTERHSCAFFTICTLHLHCKLSPTCVLTWKACDASKNHMQWSDLVLQSCKF